MSIVSHSVTTSPQSSTRLNAFYDFVDHIGGHYKIRKLVANAFDTNADALSMYTQIENGLIRAEEQRVIAKMEAGGDIENDVKNPVHSTAKELAKRAIYYMMRERDPRIVLALEPLIVYLRANYNGGQLLNFLDLTPAQGQKLSARIDAILDNKAVFTAFDDNSEDIDG